MQKIVILDLQFWANSGLFVYFYQSFVNFYCQSIISGHTGICALMTTNHTNLMVTLKICTITVYVFMPWPNKSSSEENSISPRCYMHMCVFHICNQSPTNVYVYIQIYIEIYVCVPLRGCNQ